MSARVSMQVRTPTHLRQLKLGGATLCQWLARLSRWGSQAPVRRQRLGHSPDAWVEVV